MVVFTLPILMRASSSEERSGRQRDRFRSDDELRALAGQGKIRLAKGELDDDKLMYFARHENLKRCREKRSSRRKQETHPEDGRNRPRPQSKPDSVFRPMSWSVRS